MTPDTTTNATLAADATAVDRSWPRGTGNLRYGGDYNPEQWSRETWVEDIALMQQAGINMVSVGIFSWVLLEPREGEYDFTFLDDLFELLGEAGIDIDLGTPTAAPPAWFWKAYPQALPVTREGLRLGYGSRGMAAPSSPEYRRAAANITRKLAERYATHPALKMWHVHNEYGAPVSDDYSDQSVDAFRAWLARRYGSIEALNAAWGTTFWGQVYGSFGEIDAPRVSATTVNQTQRLDFARFTSDALLECFVLERDVIRQYTPELPVTTNFMATNCPSVDYWKWASEVDVVANDHYLVAERLDNHVHLAMDADFTRSLAAGKPWMLMEHSTSAVNWQPRNIAKRPKELARNSVAHMARGADAIMFFQFRASRFGAEKFHSAMLPHEGTNSRIWREVLELGDLLGRSSEVRGSVVNARVAILWDIESFWAQDLEWRPSVELGHRERIEAFYATLWARGVTVDFAHPTMDLDGYDLVVAPASYAISDEGRRNLEGYVAAGGNLVVSYFSGIVDDNDAVPAGGHPGQLRSLLGVGVQEWLPLHEGETITLDGGARSTAWAEDLVLESPTAVVESRYADGPAAGGAAIVRNTFGGGRTWYVSTKLDASGLDDFLSGVLATVGIPSALVPGADVERIVRSHADADFTFVINHGDTPAVHGVEGFDLVTGEATSATSAAPGGGISIIRSPRVSS